MGNVYQVLLIEDDESDADLIQIELDKLDIEVQVALITQEQQLVDWLENNPPDLVISDYNLPSFNAIEALKIVREKDPHLPFILVSGNIGEEKAVDAMLEGASDYAMKSNLDRLGPAIIRELNNYEQQKKKARQLSLTRERYQSLVQSVDGIVWEADAESFEFFYVSPQSKHLLGYSPDEWLGQPNFWKSHIHPEDRSRVISFCKNKTRQGENHRIEYRMITADQEVVWLRDYVTLVTKQGEPDRLRGFMVDITNEKKAEKQRDKAYQIADIGHWELDLVHQQLHWSDTVKRLHEVPSDYEPDLDTAITFYKEGEDRQKITELVERAIETGESFDVELKIITAKGRERWLRSVGETEYHQGDCTRIYGSSQDITQRKEVEQKLRGVVEHSTNLFYRHDTDHVLTYLSPQSEQFLGCPPEEAKQRWMEFVTDHPVNEEGFRHTQKAIETGQTQPAFPLQLQKKNGEIIWVRVNEAPVTENGQTVAIVGSLTDITEQKQAEEQITETNKKLKMAQEIASLGYWELELETGEIYWSEQSYKIWEFDPEEVTLTTDLVFERMHPDDREYFREQHEKTLETGQPLNLEHRILLPDGSVKWIHMLGDLKTSPEGKPVAIEGSAQDITGEKQAKIQLEKAYKENETILESIGDAFFAVDENWIVTYWNKEAEQVLNKPKEEIVGKNLWEEYEDAVDLAFYTQYHKAVNENVSVSFEEYYPGAEKWFEVSAYPSKTGLSVYFRDITERKRNEEKIRQVNERFEKVTEATNDAIWDFDVTEGELFWGRGFEALFGYGLDETDPTLEFLISLIHPEDRGEIVQKIEEYMQPGTKTDWYEEYRFKKADGTYAPVMDRAVFIRNENGEVTRVVGAITDLTRQKKNEEALKELNRELEKHAEELAASNAELEQFAYVASHDLQEPLRMVSSFLERLEKKYGDQLDEKARQYIDFAVDGAGRMRQIILDLLNYSRVGQHEFEREQICLDKLLEEILKLEQRAIRESGADIAWEGLPEIEAAQIPIQQVFYNLVGNAIKYRKPGTEPQIRIRGEETDTHWKFSVSDNGIGIRDEFQENIFTIFQRLHTQEEYAGTGIGLAVSKKIVEKHGGSIWVDSQEGEGSTFYFTIAKEF